MISLTWTAIANGFHPDARIAVTDESVFWADGVRLRTAKFNQNGSVDTNHVVFDDETNPGRIGWIAAEGHVLYLNRPTQSDDLYSRLAVKGAGEAHVSREGGWERAFAVSDGNLYWCGKNRLYATSTTDPSATRVWQIDGLPRAPSAMQVVENILFYIANTNVSYDNDLYYVPLSTEVNTPMRISPDHQVGQTTGWASSLAIRNGYIYRTTNANLMRARLF
jgi:hypothetical protein